MTIISFFTFSYVSEMFFLLYTPNTLFQHGNDDSDRNKLLPYQLQRKRGKEEQDVGKQNK